MHIAAKNNSEAVAEQLIRSGAEIHAIDMVSDEFMLVRVHEPDLWTT